MTSPPPPYQQPIGHVLVPAAAICGLSVVLAAGLELLGIIDHANTRIAQLVSNTPETNFPKHLSDWTLWFAAVVFTFALTSAMLATPGHWRRLVLWITSVVLIATWAPVLSLAAHAPDIFAPWIATVWAGICAIVYTANHRMPCDTPIAHSNEPR